MDGKHEIILKNQRIFKISEGWKRAKDLNPRFEAYEAPVLITTLTRFDCDSGGRTFPIRIGLIQPTGNKRALRSGAYGLPGCHEIISATRYLKI